MRLYRIGSTLLLICWIMSTVVCCASSESERFLWENQPVYITNSTVGLLNYFSMKIDSQGYPRMCFAEKPAPTREQLNPGYRLKYVSWNGSRWQSFLMTFEYDCGQYCSLALDNNDYERIAYLRMRENQFLNLEYIWFNGTTWIYTTADYDAGVGKYCSIAVDSYGYAHISYYKETSPYGLKYAIIRGPGQPWNTDIIDTGPDVGIETSIALDSHNTPYISYFDLYHNNNSLRYATISEGRWIFNTVDYGQQVGGGSSIAIDTNDLPHISYYSGEANAINYASQRKDGIWIIETVDTGEIVPYTSLALDTSNNPHITYASYENGGTVKYAYKSGASWEIQDIAPGMNSKIALSKDDTPHILYENNGLYLATPLMKITSPTSNQRVNQGDSYTIQWNAFTTKEFNQNIGPYVKIEVFNHEYPVSVLTENTTNDGTYVWKISNDIKPGTYQLNISDVSDDTRSAQITITIQKPSFPGLLLGVLLIVGILVGLILLRMSLKKRKHPQTKKTKKK